jgi:ABC-2 type transport system permease protein
MRTPEGWQRAWVVAARELRERSRTRTFQWSTVFAVLAMVAIVVVPSLGSDGPRTYRVGLAGVVAAGSSDALAAQAAAADTRVRTTAYDSVAAGEQAVRARKVDVLLVDGTRLAWRIRADAALGTLVANAVQALQVRDRAAEQGLSAAQVGRLLAPVALTNDVLGSAAGVADNAREVAFWAVVLLFMSVSVYGQMVLTGVVQEKQTRVAEVLLSRMRPRELLAGKVLGIGALGLAQFALIVLAAGVSLSVVDSVDTPHVATSLWFWLVVWFVLGYAFYSVVYAAFGALASRVEDASGAAAPISIVMFAGYLAALSALESPDSSLATLLSFLPPTAPMSMPLRMTLTSVPVWQVLAAALLTGASIWLLVRVAGRVYTGAILRTGTRIPLRTAWRGGTSTTG